MFGKLVGPGDRQSEGDAEEAFKEGQGCCPYHTIYRAWGCEESLSQGRGQWGFKELVPRLGSLCFTRRNMLKALQLFYDLPNGNDSAHEHFW